MQNPGRFRVLSVVSSVVGGWCVLVMWPMILRSSPERR
jgi:hypothetical protein